MQIWRVVFLIHRTFLIQANHLQMGLLGATVCCKQTPASPALMLEVSTPESTCCERLHSEKTPRPLHLKRNFSPGLHLGSKAPKQDLAQWYLYLWTVQHHDLSRKELRQGTKSWELHIQCTRLHGANPKCLLLHSLPLHHTGSLVCRAVLPEGSGQMRRNKFSWTKQDEGAWFWLSTQPLHWSCSDSNLTVTVQAGFPLFFYSVVHWHTWCWQYKMQLHWT